MFACTIGAHRNRGIGFEREREREDLRDRGALQGRSTLVALRPMKHECHESRQKTLFHPGRVEGKGKGEGKKMHGAALDLSGVIRTRVSSVNKRAAFCVTML